MIAIIAVLAALLLPALSKAKEIGRSAVCMSNERQITANFKLHMGDDPSGHLGGLLGIRWTAFRVGLPGEGWICSDAPYRTNKHPPPANGPYPWENGSVSKAWTYTNWWPTPDPFLVNLDFSGTDVLPKERTGSYGMNGWLTLGNQTPFQRDHPPESPECFERDGQIQQPTLTPVVADCVLPQVFPRARDGVPFSQIYGAERDWPDVYWLTGDMNFVTIPRHGQRPSPLRDAPWPSNKPMLGGINAGFWDGHAEQVKLEALWRLYWHNGYQPPRTRPGLP